MASPSPAEEQAGSFLSDHLDFTSAASQERTHVTLTFAQSQDGKIAGAGKEQLALSGSESMIMTHKLRTLHDGILVGIGTVLNDNPQLNARLLSHPPTVSGLPRPVVLDSKLRMPVDCKLIRNHAAGVGRQPLVLSSIHASPGRRKVLEEAGAEVIQIDHDAPSTASLDWTMLLKHIHMAGIQRLMVEGGAAVIDSLMQQPHHIDALLVTIAPLTVGPEGFGFSSALPHPSATSTTIDWTNPSKAMFGKDQVILWHRQRH
ncbi:related to RIB7 - HTP reductase [Ustilago trichophora]|uniref:2,5-diamino-6-ribosylamino-4(3H)-pyrimidinone 5'-phosphate reductase n=1 Tax=Ustilago trichophora TaxID=86804 RepID=A0A5C3EM79_9BASI|nr:related to RIB7 - HTP reductase [Ustilago trichophora]